MLPVDPSLWAQHSRERPGGWGGTQGPLHTPHTPQTLAAPSWSAQAGGPESRKPAAGGTLVQEEGADAL